jgi:hypothetical protein
MNQQVYSWAMRIGIVLLFFILSEPLLARDVYKWVTNEGEVIYSETYQPGAERIQVTDRERRSVPRPDALNQQTQGTETVEYSSFEIVQPVNNETIRNAESTVSVGLSVTPSLASDHVIHIYVDGMKLESEVNSTQMILQNIGRGTHTLMAQISDREGNIIKDSNSITFHLRQAAVE